MANDLFIQQQATGIGNKLDEGNKWNVLQISPIPMKIKLSKHGKESYSREQLWQDA